MYLAFCFSPATSACRFICSSLIIPADNCQLVAPASQRSVLIKGAGACPALSVVRTQAVPHVAAACWNKWKECEPSLALLRTWQFPSCIVSVWRSHPRTEHTEIWIHPAPVCQGNKAVGGGGEWSDYFISGSLLHSANFLGRIWAI